MLHSLASTPSSAACSSSLRLFDFSLLWFLGLRSGYNNKVDLENYTTYENIRNTILLAIVVTMGRIVPRAGDAKGKNTGSYLQGTPRQHGKWSQ